MMKNNKYIHLISLIALILLGCREKSEPIDITLEDEDNRAYWRFYHVIQEFDEDTEIAKYRPHYSMLTRPETDSLLVVLEVYAIPYILTVDSIVYVEKGYRGIRNYNMMYTIDSALRERITWEYWNLLRVDKVLTKPH